MLNESYHPVYLNGQPWALCLPTGGRNEGEPCQWNRVMDMLGEYADLMHYRKMYSWCQETVEFLEIDSPIRGYESPYEWDHWVSSFQTVDIGYRPVLIPLNPQTLIPDPKKLASIPDGEILRMGALYMDDTPLNVPSNPIDDGDIPRYHQGARLHILDAPADDAKIIHWIKCDDFIIADRNLLWGISKEELIKQGLVFGRKEDLPKMEVIVPRPDDLVVRLAHLAGTLEANGQIEEMEWENLSGAIQKIIQAYDNDPSENFAPSSIDDAAEKYFIQEFGSNQEVIKKTPEKLVAEAKAPQKPQTFFYTFGTSESFPFQKGWIEVHAMTLEESNGLFRHHFPDKTPGILNCSSIYAKETFRNLSDAWPADWQICHGQIDATGFHPQKEQLKSLDQQIDEAASKADPNPFKQSKRPPER